MGRRSPCPPTQPGLKHIRSALSCCVLGWTFIKNTPAGHHAGHYSTSVKAASPSATPVPPVPPCPSSLTPPLNVQGRLRDPGSPEWPWGKASRPRHSTLVLPRVVLNNNQSPRNHGKFQTSLPPLPASSSSRLPPRSEPRRNPQESTASASKRPDAASWVTQPTRTWAHVTPLITPCAGSPTITAHLSRAPPTVNLGTSHAAKR